MKVVKKIPKLWKPPPPQIKTKKKKINTKSNNK